MAKAGFVYTKGAPKYIRQTDLETPRTHEFCSGCGTHLQTRSLNLPDSVYIKVETFDDPSLFDGPGLAIQTTDMQSFNHLPDDAPRFEHLPVK